MMLYAAIGGMQLKHWTGYFKIIWPTLKVLKEARKTPGCVHADTFKDGEVFFAVSVWEDRAKMSDFAKSGLHGELMKIAGDTMAVFHNHTHEFEHVPSRVEAVGEWMNVMNERGGRGSIGTLRMPA